MYTGYVAAQFYPTWGTLIPASAILGLAAAPMWSAKCKYSESHLHIAEWGFCDNWCY